jgi:translation initiation factor 2 subunit 1
MFFKKKGMPEIDETVLCTVKRLMPHCAFVSLDEYENVEAMLHISEVSTKWVRNIREFLAENKIVVCRVLKADKSEIDVSLKRVNAGEKKRKLDEVKTELRLEKLIEFVAKKFKEEPKASLEKIGRILVNNFGSLHEFYEEVKNNGVELIDSLSIPKNWQEALKQQISEQLKAARVELQKTVEIYSHDPNGVEVLKKVFVTIKELGKAKDTEMSVKYISAPKYMIGLKGDNYKTLENIMKKIIARLTDFADKKEIAFKELEA